MSNIVETLRQFGNKWPYNRAANELSTLTTKLESAEKSERHFYELSCKQAEQIESLNITIQNCHNVIGYKEESIEAMRKSILAEVSKMMNDTPMPLWGVGMEKLKGKK